MSETHREFGHVIAVVKAAEMLAFVDTPRQAVALAAAGRRFVGAGPADRRRYWREQLLKMSLFREVIDAIQRADDHVLDREVVLESIAMAMPDENFVRVFDTVLGWGRWGGLIEYDEHAEQLHEPPTAAAKTEGD